MDDATIRRLNAINREFYRITAEVFDQTRGQPWPGWEQVLAYIGADAQKRVPTMLLVLDVGCGNGRFGVFLAKSLMGGIQPSPSQRDSLRSPAPLPQ